MQLTKFLVQKFWATFFIFKISMFLQRRPDPDKRKQPETSVEVPGHKKKEQGRKLGKEKKGEKKPENSDDVVYLHTIRKGEKQHQEVCPLSLKPLGDDSNIIILKCGHRYHDSCREFLEKEREWKCVVSGCFYGIISGGRVEGGMKVERMREETTAPIDVEETEESRERYFKDRQVMMEIIQMVDPPKSPLTMIRELVDNPPRQDE